jgi:hypothetical protein
MAQPADGISISPDEMQAYKRTIGARRVEFPAPESVARTTGPAGGASADFRQALSRAAAQLAITVEVIARELADLEAGIEAAKKEFVETDGAVAKDVNALEWMLDSAEQAAPSSSSQPATTPPATSSTEADERAGFG